MPVTLPRIILVGHPNVGKSQLFNLLTGRQVTVSNYPGTTVELARGKGKLDGRNVEVIDSPGLYSFSALSPEEQVTRLLLLRDKPDLVIQVADSRNLRRMLSLTLELLEADLPVVLALNMMDEARAAGITINSETLSRRLGIPVIPTTLVTGSGYKQLCRSAAAMIRNGKGVVRPASILPEYPPALETALARTSARIKGSYGISRRAVAAALLNPDPALDRLLTQRGDPPGPLRPPVPERGGGGEPLMLLAAARRRHSAALLNGVIRFPPGEKSSLGEKLSAAMLSPTGGVLFLAAVLYFGFYRFVGTFGAGTLVDILEQRIFLDLITPFLNSWAETYLPQLWLRELLVMEYGIFTLGLRYTFAIILPIMVTFFLFFSLIEDSGYLSRAAYLVNSCMERIGLNGKAVIPLSLGLGCGTLAILVTRTLDTRRERLQASLLLSLAVPCSAQLGLILVLLARGSGLLIWLAVVLLSFMGAALLGRVFFGGEAAPFCLEIPPLRWPRPGAIIRKTLARLRWYLREVLPLFAGISVLMWALRQSGLLDYLTSALQPLVGLLGLPGETTLIFVYGFLRRDYGAAGLFDLARSGVMGPAQVLTAAVVLTLFLPCVAQITVLIREHGFGFALLVAVMTALVAWLAGAFVYLITSIPIVASLLL